MSSFTKEQIAVARSCVQLLHTFDVSLGDAAYIWSVAPDPKAVTNEWKEEVINELVVAHIYKGEHETNPRKAIQDIISWNCEAALDPKVSQAAHDLLTSKWCDECGEGVVNFCRSKADNKCKFGFNKPLRKPDVFEQAHKATKLQFDHYNVVMNPADTKINSKQEAYNEALELAAKICDEYASYSERCDSTLYGGIRSSAAESLAEDIRKQIK